MTKNNEMSYFTVTNKDGKTIKYEILFTFESEDTDKSYIVYTDNEQDKDGMIKTYASIYEEDGKELKLTPITDDKEWNLVEKLIDQAADEINEEE
ncbi:MAG: DUF1292 domain-containing protein [Bacilli bacterium]|nr:DUF1292 domain-containing protein [Bacilli bacterium]